MPDRFYPEILAAVDRLPDAIREDEDIDAGSQPASPVSPSICEAKRR